MKKDMKELLNVTVLLCEDYDENEMSIRNIFDKISIDGDKTSFCIATIINAVEYTKEKFSLHFFLANLEENKQVYIGEDAYEHQEENGCENESNNLKSFIEATSQKISVFKLDDVQFISSGAHEILVYLYENDEVEKARSYVKNQKPYDLQDSQKLVATYGFKVHYNNK